MTYRVLTIAYSAYFVVALLIVLAGLSKLVFGGLPAARMGRCVLVALLWPLALINARGRRELGQFLRLGGRDGN